jgi:hypothetical protein
LRCRFLLDEVIFVRFYEEKLSQRKCIDEDLGFPIFSQFLALLKLVCEAQPFYEEW